MKTFTDSKCRDWTVDVNVTAVKRVRDRLSIDLLDLSSGQLFEKLVADPIALVDVLYVLCEPQANERQVTDVQFGEAMAGDAIEAATTALLESLIEFFPKAKRAVLEKAVQKLRTVEAMAAQVASQRLDSPEIDAQIERLIRGEPSTNSPA